MTATASTRRNETPASPSVSPSIAEDRQANAVREVLVHAARIQLASITAASRFFAGWAQSAERYTQALSDELLDRVHGETAPSELIGRLASVSSLHLRELTALPNAAVSHFNNQLTKPAKTRRRTRRAAPRRA
jgi:hypothetical protein